MNSFLDQQKAALIACHVVWREFAAVLATSHFKITPIFFEQGLHDQPNKLQNLLQDKINQIDHDFDYILLGYGLCSNGISGLTSQHATLVIPRAHDCMTLILGSKEKYRELFDQYPGTYWFNHGWMETGSLPGPEFLETKRQIFMDKYDDTDTVDYLIEQEQRWMADYKNICLVCQPALELPERHKQELIDFTVAAAAQHHWSLVKVTGDLSLFSGLINPPWNPQMYLVIPPGQVVQPSFDEQIIKAI
ncbi:MAG: DUF1638 domain-containing protein [Eubacteriales bacterium]|nr:DUF1638 domain-containing protein [Eubacteriales bacterium]